MNTRNRILEKLRKTRIEPLPKDICPSPPVKVRNREEMIERFRKMMTAVHGEVHITSADKWQTLLCSLLEQKQLTTLIIASECPPGYSLLQNPQQVPSSVQLLTVADCANKWKENLFHQISASLTTCKGAIAETGTLILWPTPEEPRFMSLVPPVHFVLLNSNDLFNTLTDAMTKGQWQQSLPTNALLISGPSKTADIQQVLAYGAHGPKELIVLMI